MSSEEKVKKYLKKILEEKLGIKEEITMPKDGVRPDILAYKKRVNTIYLIECKSARSPTLIGHAFGQMLVVKLSLSKTKRKDFSEWVQKKLEREIKKKDIDKVKLRFGVAFRREQISENEKVKDMIKLFYKQDAFKDFRVYIVGKSGTENMHKGKLIKFKDLRKT